MPSGKPKKSPQGIAKGLAQKLHTGDYIGTRKMNRVPKEVLGYYETRANYIAVRNTEAGNYSVAMHEIGHAVAQKLGMTGTQENKKLRPFGASFLLTVNAPNELTNLLTSDVDSNVDSSAGLRAITGGFPLVQSRH